MSTSGALAKNSLNEEQRYSQYVEQRKTEHEKKLRELAEAQNEEVNQLSERFKHEKAETENAFAVSLSEESKRQSERLATLRKNHGNEYESEKKKLDAEFEQLSTRERARVENYRKKQEENLTKLHARYQDAQDELRKQNGET